MSFLEDIVDPPAEEADPAAQYFFDENIYVALVALEYIMNPSIVLNANFATLGASGLTPITEADGDGAEFSDEWDVFGAANATYSITPTAYPTGLIASGSPSTVKSASPYYIAMTVATVTGTPFYLYQRQANTVRKYQKDFFTFGIIVNNKQTNSIKIRMEMFNYYDTGSDLIADNTIYLQPGLNKITSLVKTQGLTGLTLGAGDYTEFRLAFIDLVNGTADLEIHQIKCEFGKISTLLEQ